MKHVFVGVTILAVIILPGVIHAGTSVYPVFADGWVVAGNRTVGTAVRYMRIGMWNEAQQELQKIVGYRPRNHAAQYNLGVCYERLGRPDIARRFYERAVEFRPENIYCEGLARIRGVAGTGAEFVKFLIPCDLQCRHGYAFARAGLWNEAVNNFEAALFSGQSPTMAHNLAVAYEVLGRRKEAQQMIKQANRLGEDSRYQAFTRYLFSAPQLPLDMLTSLSPIATITDLLPIQVAYLKQGNAVIRMDNSHESVALAILHQGSRVDVLESSSSWTRIRTYHNKEGYIPSLFLSMDYPEQESEPVAYSKYHAQAVLQTGDSVNRPEGEDEWILQPTWKVLVPPDGNPVAVRRMPSLLAETSGYIEPGFVVDVRQSDHVSWLEVVDAEGTRGYILKMHILEVNGDKVNGDRDRLFLEDEENE